MAASLRPILIVEDDKEIRDSLKEFLETEGYSVFAAADGEEALASLESMPRPSMILLDLFMPRMSGNQFLDQLMARRSEILVSVPIIVITAAPDTFDAVKRTEAVRSGLIRKPIDIDVFLNTIDRFGRSPPSPQNQESA